MRRYDLHAGPSSVPCGRLLVYPWPDGTVSVLFKPPTGQADLISQATYVAHGGGTAKNPKTGDTLSLGGYSVTVGSDTYKFTGSGTFVPADSATKRKKGYYYWNKKKRVGDDWGCADDGS